MTRRSRSDTKSSAGTIASTTSVSSGESTSITTSESTSSTTLPVASGKEAQQRLDQGEVGARTRHDLPGGELVVVGEVEPLHPLEDRGAQVVLHVEREAATDEASDVGEHEVHRAQADEQREQRPERALVGDDHVVDDRALDEGDGDGDERGAERHRRTR